jgi:hypothetical protein
MGDSLKVHHVFGASITDDIFEITLQTGERVLWNVTRLTAAAKAGAFGVPRYAPTADLPAAKWDTWDATDRAKVDGIKGNPEALADPAIAIESSNPDYLFCCFADGQHRITARQELGLAEVIFYVVPLAMERLFRVKGL